MSALTLHNNKKTMWHETSCIVMLPVDVIFCIISLGISTRRRSWKDTLGPELFKGIKGKKKLLWESKWPTLLGYIKQIFYCFSHVLLSADLVRETDSTTAAPGWPTLRIAGLALAAQVGFTSWWQGSKYMNLCPHAVLFLNSGKLWMLWEQWH